MKLGIVGAGALGLTFAAQLAPHEDVVVLARRPEIADQIEESGVVLEDGRGSRSVRVHATTGPQALRDRDAILITVKAYATAVAAARLRDVLRPGALVVTLQNGIDTDAPIRAALPGTRVAAGTTTQGAMRLGPAHVRAVGRGATRIGPDDAAMPTTADLCAALAAAGLDAAVADDVRALQWRKLVVNATINPLCALTVRPNGAIVEDTDLAAVAAIVAAEVAAVADGEGVTIPDPWGAVADVARGTAANRNSLLADLEAGRPTENDAILGTVIRYAGRHGIKVPLCDALSALISARERA